MSSLSFVISNHEFVVTEDKGLIVSIICNKTTCEPDTDMESLNEDLLIFKSVVIQFKEYFDGKRTSFEIPFRLECTEFQMRVLNEIKNINYGEVISYKDLSVLLFGNGNYSRAVGNALNHNPLLILLPCHRVIGSKGKLTGFKAGIDLKRILLDLEKKNILF